MSPTKICIGATIAAIHIAIENIVRARGFVAVLQQVPRADAADHERGGQVGRQTRVWTSRYGKLGLKTMANQLPAGTNWPAAFTA